MSVRSRWQDVQLNAKLSSIEILCKMDDCIQLRCLFPSTGQSESDRNDLVALVISSLLCPNPKHQHAIYFSRRPNHLFEPFSLHSTDSFNIITLATNWTDEMVSRKDMSRGRVATSYTPPPLLTSKIPSVLRFPFAVLMSLTLSAFLYTLTSDFRAGDLASVSRRVTEWWEVAGLLGCKAAELAVGWWGQYDSKLFPSQSRRRALRSCWVWDVLNCISLGIDLASLTLLTHLPPLYLLTTFYGVRQTTLLASLLIDVLTTYIPFSLLRPVSPTHVAQAPKGAVSNRSIINDMPIRLYTAILAAGIYGVTVYGSFATWLPVHLVIYFDGIHDISAAHSAALPFLIASFLPVGYAAREFIFTPATGTKRDLGDIKSLAFNPETATLLETVQYNVWGYSKRTRTLIKRTATLAALSGLNTWLQVYFTIEGTEGYGAAGWAAVWATAAAVTGIVFWWVGDVDGVSN